MDTRQIFSRRKSTALYDDPQATSTDAIHRIAVISLEQASPIGFQGLTTLRIASMAHRKPNLPEKVCDCCKRPFAWRKKWSKTWDQVRFCSERCRMAARQAKTRAKGEEKQIDG